MGLGISMGGELSTCYGQINKKVYNERTRGGFCVRLFCLILGITIVFSTPASAQDFYSWLQDLRHDVLQYGISQKLTQEALPDTLAPDDTVIRLDRRQPEGTISFETYKRNVVTTSRLKEGRRQVRQQRKLLAEISAFYGVEPQYIAALWGIETSFGGNTGGFETVPALVTLAYDGRRGPFFRQELLKALRIVDQGHIALHDMKGSWAGAMGQCQFMPTSFEKFAQDYDRDGRRDIWHSKADVFASTAAYLSGSGWKAGKPWGIPVRLPKNFDTSLIGATIQKPLQFWEGVGLHLPEGFAPDELVSIVQPGGKGYKAYAVGNNYRILLTWNNSSYFATAVGFLADGLKG
jgi:membrane-bound lytic murein transglycosylase B